MSGRATRAFAAAIAVVAMACVAAAPASAEMQISDMCFVDASYGWAVAISSDGYGSYAVVRTTDGGETWTTQKSTGAFNGTGLDVDFADRNTGIWVNSFIYRTTDGGRHWKRLRYPSASWGASRVDFATRSRVWLAGTYGSDGGGRCVGRSTNGGRTWRTRMDRRTMPGVAPSSLSAPTGSTAYVWSRGLWVTRNSGATWRRVRTDYAFKKNAWWLVDFPTAKTGWALRWNAASLVRTRDGGRHWTKQMRGLAQKLTDMDFVSARTGWVCGAAGAVYRTRDGGANWQYLKVPTDDKLISVDFCDAQHGWVATDSEWGNWNYIYRTADGGDTWELAW